MKLSRNLLSFAVSALTLLLISAIVVFIFVQFWYFYNETRTTAEKISEIDVIYERKIERIMNESQEINDIEREDIIKLSFLKEFIIQMEWESSHEKVNRRYTTFISIVEWFVLLFVLFLAVLNEHTSRLGSREDYGLKRATSHLIVFFAALAIALPAASEKLGFDARQRLHDFRAQQLGMLIVEVESGAVDPRTAWSRYQRLFQQSPSSYAEMPLL